MKTALRISLALVLAGGLGWSAAVRATAQGTSRTTKPARVDCGDLTTQLEMNECYAREAKQTGELLDSLVAELEKTLQPEESRDLQAVQKAWVAYRDAHCRWQAGFFEGGSIQPTEYATCVTDLSWSRIDALKLDVCEGHGMTGPCAESRRYDRPAPDPR